MQSYTHFSGQCMKYTQFFSEAHNFVQPCVSSNNPCHRPSCYGASPPQSIEGGGCGVGDLKMLVSGHAIEEGSKATLGLRH